MKYEINFIKNNNMAYFMCDASIDVKNDKLGNKKYTIKYDRKNDIKINDKTGLVTEIHFTKIDESIMSIDNDLEELKE